MANARVEVWAARGLSGHLGSLQWLLEDTAACSGGGAPKADKGGLQSQLSQQLALCLWTNALTSWGLCFLVYKMRVLNPFISGSDPFQPPSTAILGTFPVEHCAFRLPPGSRDPIPLWKLRLKLSHRALSVTRLCPFLSCTFDRFSDACQDGCLTILPSSIPAPNSHPVPVPRFLIPPHPILCSAAHLP